MNRKKIPIALGILALIIITVASYFAYSTLLKPKEKDKDTTVSVQTADSLYKLTQTRGNQICTWKKEEAGATINGTVYISGEKFAMDTQTRSGENAIASHLIGDGNKVYIWTDLTEIPGTTMNYAQLENPESGAQNPNGIIYQKMDYSCKKWSPDASKFTLPSNITFK